MAESTLEAAFDTLWRQLGYPDCWEREVAFAAPRKFRFDRAYRIHHVAVELDGGTWSGGRHVSGAGYARDAEKANYAASIGWAVFHLTADMLEDDPAKWLGMIARRCCLEPNPPGSGGG